MQGLLDFLKSLGAARLAAMGAVTFALIGFFAFLMIQMTAPVMVPLFTDLSVEDSSAIIKDLDRQAIDYKLKNDGAIIMVPKDKVARLRMKLAESGLPKGGGIGYEIFDKSDALGATSFIQNINHLRAMEGELARTIRSIDRVQAARVHLVLPERPLFSRDKVEASASIVLKVRGQLEPAQVRAIRHLVASAVNGLKPERVSVVDETGRLLADGAAPDNPIGAGADERKVAYENRLRSEVENIVSSVVGPGKARVQVSADFDLNRITQTQDKFDPDSRVLRSSQTREEQNSSSEGKEGGQVSASNELPGSNKDGNNNGPNSKDQSKKTEEIVNYEISRTTKTEVIEAGRLSRVSAAVLVDGRYTKNDKGEMVYEPRPKEEIDRIAALVRTAIGFDAKRGDQVEVVNLRFADSAPVQVGDVDGGWMKYLQFTKDDIMGVAEKGVMALLGLIVLLMVVRPLVRKVLAPDAAEQARMAGLAGVAGAIAGPAGVEIGPDGKPLPTITDTSGTNIAIVSGEEQVAISNRTSAMIDVAKVQGQVHAQSVQKVGELAEKNPHEAVAIIRSWLHEDAA
ncbi:MAG: flagellar M-ring protein FliF [Proteobacteria bacterium]|nr:flagellar M-ring protein FliF [Pseudomonadota bacterium]